MGEVNFLKTFKKRLHTIGLLKIVLIMYWK